MQQGCDHTPEGFRVLRPSSAACTAPVLNSIPVRSLRNSAVLEDRDNALNETATLRPGIPVEISDIPTPLKANLRNISRSRRGAVKAGPHGIIVGQAVEASHGSLCLSHRYSCVQGLMAITMPRLKGLKYWLKYTLPIVLTMASIMGMDAEKIQPLIGKYR